MPKKRLLLLLVLLMLLLLLLTMECWNSGSEESHVEESQGTPSRRTST
jgi:hypothetical protein